MDDRPIYRYRRACYGFGSVVQQVGGRWEAPSPCPEWDARGILEHVIGFHEVLLLRPLGAKANRPKDDVPGRWAATQLVLFTVLDANWAHPVALPGGSTLDVAALLPALTTEVLVHTWDLAKAIDLDVDLDQDLCEAALSRAQTNEAALRSSGMFAGPVGLPADADAQSRLVALLGRDPLWQSPRLVGQPFKVLPQRVARASELASAVRFAHSSDTTVGRLLAVLAASVPEGGRILEIGTGAGVGTSWIAEGVGPRTTIELVTIDTDASLQSSAEAIGWPDWVRFECGDAIDLVPRLGEFDLVFADAVAGKWRGLDATIESIAAGGILLVDDMAPSSWSDDEHRQRTGEVRASLIDDPRLFAVELDSATGLVMCTRKYDGTSSYFPLKNPK